MMLSRLSLVLCLLAAGCSYYATDDEVAAAVKGAIPACVPGRAVDCPCPGMTSGVQTCADDGRRFGVCACPAEPPDAGDGGHPSDPMVQKIVCDPATQIAQANYPGMKAYELFTVRAIEHRPNMTPQFLVVGGHGVEDGYVLANCTGDFDLFIGP